MSQVQVEHATPAPYYPKASTAQRGTMVVTSGYSPSPTMPPSPVTSPTPPAPPRHPRLARRQPRLRDLLPPGVRPAHPWRRLGAFFLELLLMVVTAGIGWLLWAVMIAGTGQTPAKRLLHMRVVGADTLRPIGLARMFLMRFLLGTVVAAVAFVASVFVLVVMPMWDRRRQNVWDKVSNCYVVVDYYDAWNTKPR